MSFSVDSVWIPRDSNSQNDHLLSSEADKCVALQRDQHPCPHQLLSALKPALLHIVMARSGL